MSHNRDKEKDKVATRRMILNPSRPAYSGGANWLGHGARGGKNALVDYLLLDGASRARLEKEREFKGHRTHLRSEHDLMVTEDATGRFMFDRMHLGLPQSASTVQASKMAYWRMKLREDKRGADMWEQCRREHVAAIQYNPLQEVDLRLFTPEHRPREFRKLRGSQPQSMANFAWEIRGGDTIYVGDSEKHQIVGKGYATAEEGKRAYRFDAHSPISTKNRHVPWCHLIDVDWDEPFEPFTYKDPQPQTTVLRLSQDEITKFDRSLRRNYHTQDGLTEEEERAAYLLEESYPRYTPATSRMIVRKHEALSNRFRNWMENAHNTHVQQERGHVDATFEAGGRRFLAEFKIAYNGDTKRAIREALGQILEYNHYPPRVSHNHSLLVLDAAPCQDDVAFVRCLRDKFSLPLSLGWERNSVFEFDPPLSL